ncbi:MAG: YcgN family cysteine cluster protein [Alphaproteobacteria bacterium]|nr:YcgN family cysteine cluster protein [Alphaproteobacteria bacterium]
MTEQPFWKRKSLDAMTVSEWESLCDRCGKCCMHKLEDVDSGAIAMTDVACAYLDLGTCSCTDYPNRKKNVPDCVQITPQNAATLAWLPETCAYRLLAHGQDLAWWHPLVSGKPATVHEAGISVRDYAISETQVDDIEDHVTDWLTTTVKDGIGPFALRRRR